MGWVRTPPGQSLYITDFFYCNYPQNFLPTWYFTLSENAVFYERDLVFPLNGYLVRSDGEFLTSHRTTHATRSEVSSTLDGFLQKGPEVFFAHVVLGDRKTPPVIASAAPPSEGLRKATLNHKVKETLNQIGVKILDEQQK